MHSYSYTGFEVGVEAVPADHIERNGTVCKKHLSGLRIDTGRIGLEAAFSGNVDDYPSMFQTEHMVCIG